MATILIVAISDHGSTTAMADAIAKGVRSTGGEAIRRTADEVDADGGSPLCHCDGLILGSPVHMAAPDWRLKRFIDQETSPLWQKDALVGKVGGVFCSGAGYGGGGGGGELAMLSMLADLAELGMILVPLPKNTPGFAQAGLHWGPYGRAHAEDMSPKGLTEAELETSYHHGANIARLAERIAHPGQVVFANAS